jgi:hypothetical protein
LYGVKLVLPAQEKSIAAPLAGTDTTYSAAVTIAGGELDPNVSGVDVYVGVPESASIPPGAACRVAKSYVDYIQAGRYCEVADLFADDAVILEPTRQHVRGRARIVEFCQTTIGKMKPELIAVSYLGNDTDCMVALAVRTNIAGELRYKLASVDHFTLNTAGKVTRMVAFVRI